MVYDPKIHHRRSIRLQGWDYSWAGWYYVTICTHRRARILGKVEEEKVLLSQVGRVMEEEWLRTPLVRPQVELDVYVIMPDHFHGILILNDISVRATRRVALTKGCCASTLQSVRATQLVALTEEHGHGTLQPGSLGAIIAQFKSIVTKRVNLLEGTPGRKIFQRSYVDHIIRNDADLHRIREYIRNNPMQWSLKKGNPVANR